jgi:hypothetical protein
LEGHRWDDSGSPPPPEATAAKGAQKRLQHCPKNWAPTPARTSSLPAAGGARGNRGAPEPEVTPASRQGSSAAPLRQRPFLENMSPCKKCGHLGGPGGTARRIELKLRIFSIF